MEKQDSVHIYPGNKQPEYHWSNRVVLITEDEEVNFFYLKTLLKKTEVRVLRAKNGKEAVDIITEHKVPTH
jgi:CheY-like chemotaxis protein